MSASASATRVAWTGGWENLRGFVRISALSQTELHLRHLGRTPVVE